MTSEGPAIRVRNLSKVYKVYQRPADMLWEVVTRQRRHTESRALDDVSFDVARGEVVGILGRNGAGKSTLLKILAGTLDRSGGDVEVGGSIAAILELGTGFHPEYTGRENVYMGGMCLGMSREEVDRKLDWIVDFSELGEVIDRPFKTYSSGMQGRLTFSVAASVDPDVFIIDEALATGDMLFQQKCFARVREIVAGGATVLFVSHALSSVYELCDRAILLSKGRLLSTGSPRTVGYEYERLLADERQSRSGAATLLTVRSATDEDESGAAPVGEDAAPPPPTPEVGTQILGIGLVDENDAPVTSLQHGRDYRVRVTVDSREEVESLAVSFRIEALSGLVLYGANSWLLGHRIATRRGTQLTVDFTFPCRLQVGQYVLGGGVARMNSRDDFHVLHVLRSALHFEVGGETAFQGVAEIGSVVDGVRGAAEHEEPAGNPGRWLPRTA